MDHRAVDGVDLRFHLIAVEQGNGFVAIELNALEMARHQHPHEVLGGAVAGLTFDPDLVDIVRVKIADRTLDEVRLLIDEAGGGGAQRLFADVVPQAQQIFQIALDFWLGALQPGSAQDDGHALGNVEVRQHLLQPLAVGRIGNLTGDSAAAPGVGHQHAVTARKRQVGGQRGALVAALFLVDLDQHDLPALDHFLYLVAAQRTLAALMVLTIVVVVAQLFHGLAVAISRGAALTVVLFPIVVVAMVLAAVLSIVLLIPLRGEPLVVIGAVLPERLVRAVGGAGFARALILVGRGHGGELLHHLFRVDRFGHHRAVGGGLGARLGLLLQASLLGHQGFAVGDRDAVIVGMDLREGEEAMAVAAIFHECRLQRRLDPGHLREIDVALELLPACDLEIELIEPVSIDHGNPGLFRVRGVHQHTLGHSKSP